MNGLQLPCIDSIRPYLTGRRSWLIALAALILVGGLIFLIGSSSGDGDEAAPQVPALTVTGAVVGKADWPDSLVTSGAIAAWQEAIVGAEISGQRLVELLVNVGDKVTKGQVLARYNTDTLLAERAELQADWVQAEANRKRGMRLKAGGALSEQKIDSYVAAAAVARARLERKNLELRYATIVAPDDGVISSRMATLGAVSGNGTELFRIILKGRLEWRGDLTAQQLLRAAPGQSVELALPDNSKAKAVVRQISPSLNEMSRMATVYADIEPGSSAHAGMYATGAIIVTGRPAIIVPAVCVVIRDGRSYVFKLGAKTGVTKVVSQEVVTGRHQGSDVEIVSGLNPGEHIAAWGAGFLNDGDNVLLVSDPTGTP
jgi:RND family efflux transporter MFP subunit